MKRIKNACLLQTVKFELREELESYKSALTKKKTKYVIEDEQTQADGSIMIRLKRQYNNYDTGDYFN